jgi:hypothetical protein
MLSMGGLGKLLANAYINKVRVRLLVTAAVDSGILVGKRGQYAGTVCGDSMRGQYAAVVQSWQLAADAWCASAAVAAVAALAWWAAATVNGRDDGCMQLLRYAGSYEITGEGKLLADACILMGSRMQQRNTSTQQYTGSVDSHVGTPLQNTDGCLPVMLV